MTYLRVLGLIQRFLKSDCSQIKRQKLKIPDILVKKGCYFLHILAAVTNALKSNTCRPETLPSPFYSLCGNQEDKVFCHILIAVKDCNFVCMCVRVYTHMYILSTRPWCESWVPYLITMPYTGNDMPIKYVTNLLCIHVKVYIHIYIRIIRFIYLMIFRNVIIID